MRTILPADVTTFLDNLTQQYPGFSLVTKPYTSDHCTTWGTTVYVSSTWDLLSPAQQFLRLMHEAVHLRQYADLGTLRFAWRYLWASGRWDLERPAYTVELATVGDVLGLDALRQKRAYYVQTLSGSAYHEMLDTARAAAWVDLQIAQCTSP